MTGVLAPIAALLFGSAILVLGQGLFLVLVPLSLDEIEASARSVSIVVSAYFAGFVFGAWYSGRVIHTVGHVRAYGGLIAVVLTATLSLPLFPSLVPWILLRFLHGAAVSGAFVTVESWLNTASPKEWRGRVLATYTFLSLAALGGGQLLLNVYGTAGFAPFNLGSILLALSIVPVVLSRLSGPVMPPVEIQMDLELMRRVPLGLVIGVASGLLTGSFWALAPLFAASVLDSTSAVTMLVGTAISGGLLLQWPIGFLSDRRDRRSVILGVTVVGAAASLAIFLLHATSIPLLFAAVLVYGATTFSLHPLALAHCADHAASGDEMLSLSQSMLLANGIGLTLGPLLAGLFAELGGRESLFLLGLTVNGLLAVAIVLRMRQRAPIPADEKSGFRPAVDSTPAQLVLDPRTTAMDARRQAG